MEYLRSETKIRNKRKERIFWIQKREVRPQQIWDTYTNNMKKAAEAVLKTETG